MNILIFGSSITWGAWDKEGGWAQRLKSFADKKALSTNFNYYTAVYCLGVSGDTTTDLLERFDTEVNARADEHEDLLIIIETGINDSQLILAENRHAVSPEEYKKNLAKLVEKSKHYNAKLIFLGLTPVDERVDPIPWAPESSYRIEFVKKYDEILKSVSRENNIPYIELMSRFSKSNYPNLLTDGAHPSTEGHKIIYEEVRKNLSL